MKRRDIKRKIEIYGEEEGFELSDEMENMRNRKIEKKILLKESFMENEMKRIEESEVRLMVMREENEKRRSMRFVMKYKVERKGMKI